MKALPWIAMGFVVLLLTADAGGWDLLADPAGWVLVLVGMRALPPTIELRSTLCSLAVTALVVAAVTWPPYVANRLADADPSLTWAAGLPQLGYVGVLAHALMVAATRAEDRGAGRWWSAMRTVTIVVALLPVLVFGGGVTSLDGVAGVLTVVAPLLVVVLLFAHGSRPWAVADVATAGAAVPDDRRPRRNSDEGV